MTSAAWERLDRPGDYEALWQRFERLYGFRADVEPKGWPAINEPPGSVTFDLSPVWAGDACGFWTEQAVNLLVMRALACVVPEGDPILVLDWQHSPYRFWPHRLPEEWARTSNPFPHGVTPCPDGDYYAYLTEEMTMGTFGHPWEQTLCVIGEELVATLLPSLSPLLPAKRRKM